MYQIDTDSLIEGVPDRFDGVLLLAEALSHAHAMGRFHELIRFFERAFASSSIKLAEALSQFLAGASQGFTRDEVHEWVKGLRDPATHADGKQQAHFVLESDVRPVIARMEQAAYDVLMNKTFWHDPSITRRSLWRAAAGTISPAADIFIEKGKDIKLTYLVLDEFRAYPANLDCVIGHMPDGWWSKWPNVQRPGE